MRLIQLKSIAELREREAAWDDLWRASDVAAPTARAQTVALWLEHFAPRDRFRCLVVEQDGALGAALPLVATRVKGLLTAGGVVANCWSSAGQLLIDPLAGDEALDLLRHGIARLPWPILWLEGINPHTEAWQRLLWACDRAEFGHEFRHDRQVGLIDIGPDWPAYAAARSKNLKRSLRRASERLAREGAVQFRPLGPQDPRDAETVARQCFELEHRSWKRAGGAPVMSEPAALAFFLGQARQLAAWGALEIDLLELNGQPIAFQYGYQAKQVHFAHKAGYDEAFAAASPGQLLMHDVLRSLHTGRKVQLVDCLGPMNDAVGRWTTRSYPEGRLLIAPRRMQSRLLWWAYQCGTSLRDAGLFPGQRVPTLPANSI